MKITNQKNLNQGFTLIELLVVISIIGLLSSVVLTSLSSAREKAYAAKTTTELRQIRIVLEEYYNDNGGYPYPPGGGLYCLGTTCTTPSTIPGGPLTEFAYTNNSLEKVAATAIPTFSSPRVVDGWSGYIYYPCSIPVTIGSKQVCPGNTADTSVSIITVVGNTLESISSDTGWILSDYAGGGS